jgi:hypothetical protein
MKIFLLAAALLWTSQAHAANVVFDHPSAKAKLTVHTEDGAPTPAAISYEGPLGYFLVTQAELAGLAQYDGWMQTTNNVYTLQASGLQFLDQSYSTPRLYGYAADDSVPALESVIRTLQAKGQQEAPDEFAARVADLRHRAGRARMTLNSMTAMARMSPGSVQNPEVVAQQEKPIAQAEKDVAEAAALRVTGEADAARAAASPEDPNPRADFYWRESLKLDSASSALSASQYALDQQPVPAY